MEDLTCDADKNMGSDALDVFFKTSKHPPCEEIMTPSLYLEALEQQGCDRCPSWGGSSSIATPMPMRVKNSKDLRLPCGQEFNGLALQYAW